MGLSERLSSYPKAPKRVMSNLGEGLGLRG